MTIPQVTINKWLKQYGYLPSISYYGAKRLDVESTLLKEAKDKLSLFYDDPDDLETIVTTPRCGCPDFEDTDLNLGVFGATGSGSWPSTGCDPQFPGIHSIRVGINTRGASSSILALLPEALEIASATFAEMGLHVRYILNPKAGEEVEISKVFGGLGGSTIGWNYFHQGGCNKITGKLSSRWNPGSAIYWAGLEVHETGHGCGLRHTRGGIMNPSILKLNPLTFKGTPSHSTMVRYFGGEPLDTPKPNPPIPVPPKPNPPKPEPEPDDDSLLERILERIRERLGICAKSRSQEEIKRRIKSRGLRERIQLRNMVREIAPVNKQRSMYKAVLKEWYEADDQEIDMLTEYLPDKFEI